MTAATERTDFPVTWENPADAEKTWRHDPEHTPAAVSPLGFELGIGPFVEGFGWGMKPIQVNYYAFFEFSPPAGADGPPSKPTAAELRKQADRWHAEILPEVLGHVGFYRNTDFDALSDEDLAAEVERLRKLRYRQGELHTAVVSPGWSGVQFLIDTYRELTGDRNELNALQLVQGHGNKSVEAGDRLWRVSQTAATIPAVRDRLLALEKSAASGCLRDLERDPDAAPFIQSFNEYLDAYGWRSGAEFAAETWFESPETPLLTIRSLLERQNYDPAAEQSRLAAQRDEAIATTMAQLDAAGRERLQEAVDLASLVVSFAEDHNFYIDQRMYLTPRRLLLAVGRRVVQKGALGEPDDVFYLRVAEVLRALRGETDGVGASAAKRKQELSYWRTVRPPSYIGAIPPGQDGRAPSAPRRDEPAKELHGTPASAGVVRAVARVVLTLEESDRLHSGEVLVTRVTQPAWTPLFGIAGAVVTEVGGVLSHTAIAAREYGLPAVVNVRNATKLLREGQLVEVDGGAGVVRVLD